MVFRQKEWQVKRFYNGRELEAHKNIRKIAWLSERRQNGES